MGGSFSRLLFTSAEWVFISLGASRSSGERTTQRCRFLLHLWIAPMLDDFTSVF